MSKKDGGPAFGHGAENGHCCGMTLRDYFAAQALTGMIASAPVVDRTGAAVKKPRWADVAYEFADAMLEAREQK